MKSFPLLLAQGVLGGALGGFVYVFLVTLRQGSSSYSTVLNFTPLCMAVGCIIGVVAAASVWLFYSSTGIQIRATARLSVASVIATLIVLIASLQFTDVEYALTTLLTMILSFAVPIALIVGSNIRSWELFTFGTIAVRGDGFDELFASGNVLAIAGTLPLRFLSLGIAGIWLLKIAYDPKGDAPYIPIIIVGGLPLLYCGISAFLTFRSPGKLLLLLLGIGGNIPVICGGLLCFSLYSSFPGMYDLLILAKICCAFLISWTIFLIGRLSVNTRELRPLSILPDKQGFISKEQR
jgi:hypothetical protein